jgi:hypothetical protein
MKETRKLMVIIAAAFLSMPVSAQKNDCTYKQEFSSKPGTYLNVNSRYGDIE